MALVDVLTSVFAGVILVCAVRSTNHMSRHTCHFIRISVLAVAVSALGLMLAPLYPNAPESKYVWPIFVVSVAVFMVADGRRRKRGPNECYH